MRVLKIFPILLALYEVVTYLSNDMYLPALPQLANDLHTTNALAQLSLTTWFLGAASMQLILGPISDRYGRKPVLLIGGIFFVIATLICAMTPDMTTMLIARFFQGCAVCSVTVAGYATIHELYDQKAAMKALALMGSITVLAPAFGP
ncbi:MAG: MFS transporter, partial [Gammaproteobacteria bacterium]